PAKDFGSSVDTVAGPHESAHRSQTGLAVILFLLGDEEYRIAVERIIDGCFGNRDDGRLVRQHYCGSCGHAWLEDVVGIGDGRLNADVAGVGRDLGLDRGDLSLKAAAGIGVDQNAHDLPDLEISAVLFRYREVG